MATPSPRPTAPAAAERSARTDRWLHALGVEPGFADAVLGDLAEEYAERAARDGVLAARGWYVREALLAVPHVLWSALRHGDARQRARLATCGAAVALTLTAATAAVLTRSGPPARLAAGTRDADVAEGIVINDVEPVQLPVRVLDANGRHLKSEGVRYRWESGAPLAVSPSGVVTCTERGDATIHASLGAIATRVGVRCRPVREVQAATWISFVVGSPPRDLPFRAIGVDGRPVTHLRGAVRVLDSAVATLAGARIRPISAGETAVAVEVGNRAARIRVLVHEPVRAFTGLRPDQRLVAMPVRLARGDTVTWELPGEAFWLKYIPRRAGEAPPTITLDAVAVCGPGDGVRTYHVPLDEYGTIYCLVHAAHPRVTVAHGAVGAPIVDGWLAIERVEPR